MEFDKVPEVVEDISITKLEITEHQKKWHELVLNRSQPNPPENIMKMANNFAKQLDWKELKWKRIDDVVELLPKFIEGMYIYYEIFEYNPKQNLDQPIMPIGCCFPYYKALRGMYPCLYVEGENEELQQIIPITKDFIITDTYSDTLKIMWILSCNDIKDMIETTEQKN
jgi:hypothetical protein